LANDRKRRGERLFAFRIDTEFLEEMKGIVEGTQNAGIKITWEEVLVCMTPTKRRNSYGCVRACSSR